MIEIVAQQRFGTLIVADPTRVKGPRGKCVVLCLCDCGKSIYVRPANLNSGHVASCGCAKAGNNRTHGLTKTPEHPIWRGLLDRCLNANNKAHGDYGGRGIKVCERWLKFENFYADMGKRPSPKHSLDRFPNNDGNYEPGNVRWATAEEQARNRRNNRNVEFNGKTQCLSAWETELGLPEELLRNRLRTGMSVETAFAKPHHPHERQTG